MTKQLLFIALFISAITFAQSPQKMSYQGVLRNSSSVLITSAQVGMRISILQSSATGTVAYSETQSPTTNANGLVSLEIGSGTPVTGTFAGINWANGPYFIKTETDPAGGTNYTINGTSQLMSVPYALFSANATAGPQGPAGAAGLTTSVNGVAQVAGAITLTTADIAASNNKNYVTDAQQAVIGNTSGTNTGDNATNSLYSGLVTNATHTGDVTGATALTIIDDAVTAVKILDANVTNAKLDKANIPLSGFGAAVADVALGAKKLTGVANPTDAQDAATKVYVDLLAAQVATLQAKISDLVVAAAATIKNVTIGTQVWQRRNLDLATYRDGTIIPEVTDPDAWKNLKTGAWCYVRNDPANGETYGKLYNWCAVMGITVAEDATPTAAQIAARKQLAPIGWHVPTNEEWTTLTIFLDQQAPVGNIGNKMRETGVTHWSSPNAGATNSSGFTGLPGGLRSHLGAAGGPAAYGFWWSSTEIDPGQAYFRFLYFDRAEVGDTGTLKAYGLSVRCLRD
jgi:uncharacterized protein (TIGR02145 family)